MSDLLDISKDNDDFILLSGDDPSFLSMMQKGGDGVISVAANVVPNTISNICALIYEGKTEEAININQKLCDLYELLFIESNPIPVKWMLYKMNFIKNSIRLPLVELDKKYQENVLNEMLKLELL